jgi:TetR/AcrR family transcriptional regulator, copper-responsive repressor
MFWGVGRPEKFTRDGVLQKAMSLFWQRGFADTRLEDLEKATVSLKHHATAE